jgi:hypothetical protein
MSIGREDPEKSRPPVIHCRFSQRSEESFLAVKQCSELPIPDRASLY